MKRLKEFIMDTYNLDMELIPFGEGNFRNNIFIGNVGSKEYIVKVEEREQKDNIRRALQIGRVLEKNALIRSSVYIESIEGDFVQEFENKLLTVQHKEELKKIEGGSGDLYKLGKAVGEFHLTLRRVEFQHVMESDFYKDYMLGEVPKSQTRERFQEIEKFYLKNTPDYKKLMCGVIHNDLNINNIFRIERSEKYFIIDFEHQKHGPLVSDLGVLALQFWNDDQGIPDYERRKEYLLKGYSERIQLSEYDIESIRLFSLRYLYSDENWYTYWMRQSGEDMTDVIHECRKKQRLLELKNK